MEIASSEFLELGGHEPFARRQRLFPDVIAGNVRDVVLADFDRVAEGRRVLHLERFDAGALALALFQFRKAPPRVGPQRHALRELRVRLGAHDAEFGELSRRVVGQGSLQVLENGGEVADAPHERFERGRRDLGKGAQHVERSPQRDEIARQRAPEADFLGDALQIEAAAEDFAHRLTSSVFVQQRLHAVLALRDRVAFDQRRGDPAREHPRTHRRGATVQGRQQRRARILSLRSQQLQVLARGRVERHERTTAIVADVAQRFGAAGDAGAADERAERVERAVDRDRFVEREILDGAAFARLGHGKRRARQARPELIHRSVQRGANPGRNVGDDFGGPDAPELGDRFVVRAFSRESGRRALARRDVRVCHCERLADRRERR